MIELTKKQKHWLTFNEHLTPVAQIGEHVIIVLDELRYADTHEPHAYILTPDCKLQGVGYFFEHQPVVPMVRVEETDLLVDLLATTLQESLNHTWNIQGGYPVAPVSNPYHEFYTGAKALLSEIKKQPLAEAFPPGKDKAIEKAKGVIESWAGEWPEDDWVSLDNNWDLNLYGGPDEKEVMLYSVWNGMTDTSRGISIIPDSLEDRVNAKIQAMGEALKNMRLGDQS